MPAHTGASPGGGGTKWAAIAGAMAVAIAATAGITYALTRPSGNDTAGSTTTSSQESAADQEAAKKNLCEIFDISVRVPKDQGPLSNADGMNVRAILRIVNSASAVRNALTPAVPEDIAEKAKAYIDTTFAMTSAAASPILKTQEVNERIVEANKATDDLIAICGLPQYR